VALVGLVWMAGAAAYSWSQQQYFVGEQDGSVTIFRGLNADVPGIDLSHAYQTTNVSLDRLSDYDASTVRAGIDADSLADAQRAVKRLAANQSLDEDTTATPTESASPSDTASPTATATPTDTASATP
jgi:protein phosphatase